MVNWDGLFIAGKMKYQNRLPALIIAISDQILFTKNWNFVLLAPVANPVERNLIFFRKSSFYASIAIKLVFIR